MPTEGRVYQDGLDLVFSPTEGGDSGTYTCVAQNKAGRRTQEVTFTVASESYTDSLKGTVSDCIMGNVGSSVFKAKVEK